MGFVRRYPLVAATVLCGLVVAGLLLGGEAVAAQWAASIYALFITVRLAADMVRAVVRARLGIDLLAVAAVASTVAVGEYIASLIVVLMLSGGRALEDFARDAPGGN